METPNTQENQIQKLENMPAPSAEYIAAAESRSLNFLNPKLWQAMTVVAQEFYRGGALPTSVKNPQQLLMVLQAGYEAGMQPIEAINSYYFVNGKLAMYGEMAIALVSKQGHKVEFIDCDSTKATCKITRKDDERSLSSTFTMADANARGLSAKEVWKKFPENMLKFKAFHMTAKFIVPDAFHGVPLKEELEDMQPIKAETIPDDEQTIEYEAATRPRKSLDQALAEPLPAQETAKKSKKKEKFESPLVDPNGLPSNQDTEETADARYKRLVDLQIEGKTLSAEDLEFIRAHEEKTR